MKRTEHDTAYIDVAPDEEILHYAALGWTLHNGYERIFRMSRGELVTNYYQIAVDMKQLGKRSAVHTDGSNYLSIHVEGEVVGCGMQLFGDMDRDLARFDMAVENVRNPRQIDDLTRGVVATSETICDIMSNMTFCLGAREDPDVGGHVTVQQLLLAVSAAEAISIASAASRIDVDDFEEAEYLWSVYQALCEADEANPTAYLSTLDDTVRIVPFSEVRNPFFKGAKLECPMKLELNALAAMPVSNQSLSRMDVDILAGSILGAIARYCALNVPIPDYRIPAPVYLAASTLAAGGFARERLKNQLGSPELFERCFTVEKDEFYA